QLHVHLVFATKGRQELIESAWEARLYSFLGGIARDERCTLIAAGGMPEHVHLLVDYRSDISVADLVRKLKSRSSAWINQERLAKDRFAWQEGYGGFAVGTETLPRVKGYIAKQKEHHRHTTFRDEVVAMLRRAGMDNHAADVLTNLGFLAAPPGQGP
ncbi:MAG TPA: IS200/IS605 family transposase, partial [Phycisphaerales bacterium]|nr:IS200/IS605 family transposase [Phycisphaerales bacterium]